MNRIWSVTKHARKVVGKPAKQRESNIFFTGRLQQQPEQVGDGLGKMVALARCLWRGWTMARMPLFSVFLLLSRLLFFREWRGSSQLERGALAALRALPTLKKEWGCWGLFIKKIAWDRGRIEVIPKLWIIVGGELGMLWRLNSPSMPLLLYV